MSERIHAPQVGAPDPERRNSLIMEETDEEFDFAGMEMPETGACYFNDTAYMEGQFICSGSELLLCTRGGWLREGSCDPDNPD